MIATKGFSWTGLYQQNKPTKGRNRLLEPKWRLNCEPQKCPSQKDRAGPSHSTLKWFEGMSECSGTTSRGGSAALPLRTRRARAVRVRSSALAIVGVSRLQAHPS